MAVSIAITITKETKIDGTALHKAIQDSLNNTLQPTLQDDVPSAFNVKLCVINGAVLSFTAYTNDGTCSWTIVPVFVQEECKDYEANIKSCIETHLEKLNETQSKYVANIDNDSISGILKDIILNP